GLLPPRRTEPTTARAAAPSRVSTRTPAPATRTPIVTCAASTRTATPHRAAATITRRSPHHDPPPPGTVHPPPGGGPGRRALPLRPRADQPRRAARLRLRLGGPAPFRRARGRPSLPLRAAGRRRAAHRADRAGHRRGDPADRRPAARRRGRRRGRRPVRRPGAAGHRRRRHPFLV